MTNELGADWDFDDLDATERRFEERLAHEDDAAARAELLTQLARVSGLRGDFGDGERLLREAKELAGSSQRALIRIELERGRLLRSGGDPAASLPLFVSASERAGAEDELFIAADAAHMAALVADTPEERRRWTKHGIELAESGRGEARYWLGPLLNNLGWDLHEAGDHEQALVAFERALSHRENHPASGDARAIAFARYAVAKAQQTLGRHDAAVLQLELAIASTQTEGVPDGWFHEAIAESSAALGRDDEARENAILALSLLPDQDPAFNEDDGRVARLRELARA